mgnify:CR=1 FL=1
MDAFLTPELQAGLDAARKLTGRAKARFRIEEDGHSYPVLRLWDAGFAIEAQGAPKLRGLVDLYDGGRQMMQCLIVASEEVNGEMRYEFKRSTAAMDRAPLDFVRDENAPVGLIARG